MESIAQLGNQYLLLKLGFGNVQSCIDWAIERLQLNQEGDDLNVVLLAAATNHDEAFPLVEKIVMTYSDKEVLDEQLVAGKYIAALYEKYISGTEPVESLDLKFSKLFNALGYPSWLVMLSRNCEYATDIPAFQEPFEKEFSYIAGLWSSSSSRLEFESQYSRKISDQHDATFLLTNTG
jgi:hypothetical protein